MGGVGKTQLAVAFARELISRNQVSLVVWVPASSRTGVITAYAAAADTVEVGADNPEQAYARFRGWLSSTDRRWAIILDDVSDPADLRGLWPPNEPWGTTVVTTRRRDASLVAERILIDVDVFTADQARAYLTERLTPDLADDIDGLAADLGYLPLALSHAAAHLIDRELPASTYRQEFGNRKRQLATLFPATSALFDSETSATIATTWSMSIEQADDQMPIGLARPLLTLASLLDPNGIPLAFFYAAATRDYLATLTADEAASDDECVPDPADIGSALANLRRFNLITVADSVVRVHALVQRAVRETLPRVALTQVVRCAADALMQTWPPVEHGADAALVVLLQSNAELLGELIDAENLWRSADNACDVLLRRVESISNAALARAAFDAATRLHDQTNRALGAEHRCTLKARHHIADITGELGDPAGAVRAYEALLKDNLSVLGPVDADTLHTRSNLAYRRAEAGDPSGAAEAFAKLEDDYIHMFGADNIESLRTRQFFADCLGDAGDARGAVAVLRPLLEDQLRVLDPKHPHTMITRNSLAQWLGTSGDTAGAVAMMEQVVADRLDTLGPNHVATLNARTNLAQWQGKAGDPASAVSMLEAVVSDRTKLLGAHHLSTLTTRRALIRWRGECGDAAGAVVALAQLLAEMEATIAREHPEVLRTRYDLARWRARAGDLPGALALLEGVLNSQITVLGATHPETLTTHTELASWLGAAGQATAAANELCDVLAVRTQVLGPDHPDTLATLSAVARWRGESGDPLDERC
jgi:Tetratricopeptide repeat